MTLPEKKICIGWTYSVASGSQFEEKEIMSDFGNSYVVMYYGFVSEAGSDYYKLYSEQEQRIYEDLIAQLSTSPDTMQTLAEMDDFEHLAHPPTAL